MLRVALTGLAAKKLRLLTTALAVTIGVAFMAGTFVLTDTINRTFDDLFADVYRGTDVVVRGKAAFDSNPPPQTTVPEDLLPVVAGVPGVALANGDASGYAQIVGSDGKPLGGMGAPMLGVSWTDDQTNPFVLAEGTAPRGDGEVVIDKSSATRGKLAVGQDVRVLFQGPPETYRISGIATFGTADSPGGASVVAFTPAEAQRRLVPPGTFSSITAVGDGSVGQDELAARVRSALGDRTGVEVVTGAELTAENQNAFRDGLAFFSVLLLVFAGVALFVGCFIIYNTFSIIVAQRSREMALLRAIGASRRQVLWSVMLEAVVIGLFASVVGLVAGIGMSALLRGMLAAVGFDIPAAGVVLAPRTIVVSLLVGTLITVVSAVFPARRAARVPPVAAMRDVAVERAPRIARRAVIGGVILAVGLGLLVLGLTGSGTAALSNTGLGAAVIFLGVAFLGPVLARPLARVIGSPLPHLRGITGTVARENAMRNPRRTASTASALMIGVALVGTVMILAASVRASINEILESQFRADFVVQTDSFMVGLSPELGESIRTVPGVEAMTPVRFAPARIAGNDVFLIAVDPVAGADTVDLGTTQGTLDALNQGGLAVHESVATERNWKIGDVAEVTFAETGVRQLPVVAIYQNNEAGGNYLIGLETHRQNVSQVFDFQIYVKAAPGTDTAALRASLERLAEPYPTATVRDAAEFARQQADQINQVVNLFYVLLALSVVIALMGIANTLALSIFERTRELGLLRAVGMTRRQLRASIGWESVIIALIGTVTGLVIGLFFGWAITRALASEGFTAFAVPGGQLAVVVLAAAFAGIVAAAGPARRASRLDVLAAIATE